MGLVRLCHCAAVRAVCRLLHQVKGERDSLLPASAPFLRTRKELSRGFAVSSSPTQPKPKDDAATRKKTDAPSPDEPPKEEEEPRPEPAAETEQSFVAAAEDEEGEEAEEKVKEGTIWLAS